MKDRIRKVRQSEGKNQTEFGAKIGVSGAAISRWEAGERGIPDSAIRSICREFNVNEAWLREGVGEMKSAVSRSEEMATAVKRLFSDRPASFQSALVTALLRFDPDGPEWDLLERIFESVEAEIEKGPDAS